MVSFILLQKKYAGIAQSVEQLIRNQQVVCSSHITSSTGPSQNRKILRRVFFCLGRLK